MRLVYTIFDFAARGWTAADLPRLLDAARTIGMAGLNITYPYKQAVIPLLDRLADSAQKVGAVNTVAITADGLVGHNTDATGFAESVRRGLAGAAMTRVVQIGAGGAGFATAYGLLALGVDDLCIADHDAARAAALVARLAGTFGPRATVCRDLAAAVVRADGIVNATPMGMAAHPGSPLPPGLLRPALWVADIVYFPLETELLRQARAVGCRTLDGSGMVVHQAAEAFDIFTGRTADRARMAASFGRS